MSLSDVMEEMDNGVTSLGIHVRAGDDIIHREEGIDLDSGECDSIAPESKFTPLADCISQLAERLDPSKKRVIVIFSDSRCIRKHFMDHVDSSLYTEIWTQKIG